ncbi:putative type IX secretion system sortase PorU2 [Pedobacter arcticus]|uniref:putative type IX secretion system sortase PorU2 n=1 Tax=Pedobacter arcticus TaxID=752140 RepID=UPI000368AD66|nr:C25 family cysteine peptidase [Pedobacter arcticus]
MKKHLLLLVIFFSLIWSKSYAQTYGNEWINASQKYLKIKVSEEGIYKITLSDINAGAFQTGQLNPSKLQIFNKGVEVPLYITGTADGSFDNGDLIYFYGNKNNASLDKVLYQNPADLPNSEVSLFENDNYYFLTYSTANDGLRYIVNNQVNTSLTPESFVVVNERINLSNSYYPGEYILDAMSLSEYTEGEGYLGSTFGKGENQNYQLNTLGFLNTPSFQPTISFYVAGRSNASSTNSQSKNHHLRISTGGSPLFDSLYRGYTTIRKTVPLTVGSATTAISVSSVDDLGAVTDFQALGYIQLNYSRNLDLNSLKNLTFNVSGSKESNLLNFTNSGLTTAFIVEKNGTNIYFANSTTASLQFSLKNTNTTTNYYLADLSLSKPVTTINVSFKNTNPASSKSYLMISHTSLSDGALAYKQYNESIGMPTALEYTEDLYNEFYYGFHHPMALRNYCNYMIEKGSTKPEYLLLLGKGYENSRDYLGSDLVPTMGFPGSDNMLTAGLNGSKLEPGLATGRVPAENNADIYNYLNKIKAYNTLGDDLWRKRMLFISGGRTLSENSSFQSYQNSLAEVAKKEFYGANPLYVKKNVNVPVTESFTDVIVKETQQGLGLISFLGHGSTITTEILMGEPATLGNKEKPTIYLVNGCSTGNVFSNVKSLGERFLLQEDFGAVGWIGTSSEGVASYLNSASLKFYQSWFVKNYGISVSKGIKIGLGTFQSANDKLNLAHTRQYIFLGDPYLKFLTPDKPDYSISNSEIFPAVSNQNSTNPTLQINAIISNKGKAVIDSLEIQVSRTLPNNSVINLPIFKIKPVFNSDTLALSLDNNLAGLSGNNKISIKLNPRGTIGENANTNNDATLEIFLPGNSINLIYPLKNSILNTTRVELKAQPDDLFTLNAEYLFEIDTSPNFDSNFKKTSPIIKADLFPTWSPDVLLENGKLYYWRARLNLPIDKGGQWAESSFTYVQDSNDGFMVSSYNQLKEFDSQNIVKSNDYLEFVPDVFSTTIQTRGDDASTLEEKRYRYGGIGLGYFSEGFEGITLVAYDPVVWGKRFSYPSPFNVANSTGPIIGYTGQYYWNTNNAVELDSLLSYLKQVPLGSNVVCYNGYNISFKELPLNIKNELRNLGLVKFENLERGEPYMFWAVKGGAPGTAIEVTADYSSSIPPRQQIIKKAVDLQYKASSGSIESTKIGPAIIWNSLESLFDERPSDNLKYSVIGIDNKNQESVLLNNFTTNNQNLSSINATNYPYIKIKISFENSLLRTIPLINQLKVFFQPVPELSFNPQLKNEFYKDEIQEGDSLKINYGLSNLSKYQTDSIGIYYQIVNNNKPGELKLVRKIGGLKPFENTTVSLSQFTNNLGGENIIRLTSGYEKVNDAFQFNNFISKRFTVLRDEKEPVLNVLFDGRSIINGETVSSSPLISITATDENQFLLMKDTSKIDVYLKGSKESEFKKISYSSNVLTVKENASPQSNKYVLDFTPKNLADDIYTLKIKYRDNSGNGNSKPDFLVDFNIINESAISNFYPYPNPVVSSMNFVFTITGNKIPDKINIQIFTASGKVVREINRTELGNLRIGNNKTDFTWDGTDMYGDRLANGVYFYKVTVGDNEDKTYKKIQATNSKLFKNNIGKIYLLR